MNGVVACAEGHLGQDGELRYTATGQAVCSFSVAVFDAKRQDGADTEWLKVSVWGDEAERLAPALVKGAEVYVYGRVKLHTWQGQDGQQRAGLQLSVWECTVKGAIGKKSYPRGNAAKLAAVVAS